MWGSHGIEHKDCKIWVLMHAFTLKLEASGPSETFVPTVLHSVTSQETVSLNMFNLNNEIRNNK
jgi:hypothetical protein